MEYIAVRLSAGQDVDVLRSRIDAQFANSSAPVKTYSSRALLRAYYGSYRELARLSVVVLAVSAVTLLLIAGSVLAQAQRERAKESVILEAIGWSKPGVAALLGLESFVLLLPPAALGLMAAGVLARGIEGPVSVLSRLSTRATVEGLLLAVVLALAVSAIPVLRSFNAPIAPRLMRE
jgi:putative ABC transport system permease protein